MSTLRKVFNFLTYPGIEVSLVDIFMLYMLISFGGSDGVVLAISALYFLFLSPHHIIKTLRSK